MKKSIIVLLCLVFLISCWETSIEVNDDWAKVNVPWAKIEVNDDWAEVNINPAEIIEVVEKLEDFGENNNETISIDTNQSKEEIINSLWVLINDKVWKEELEKMSNEKLSILWWLWTVAIETLWKENIIKMTKEQWIAISSIWVVNIERIGWDALIQMTAEQLENIQ